MYRKCSEIRKLVAHAVIGWSTMSKCGFKKWLLERRNQFFRSFGRMNLECYHPRLTCQFSWSRHEKKGTYFLKTINIQKWVPCALWRLWTGNSNKVVSKVFGVGKSTVSQIVKEFCKTLRKTPSCFIKFPKTRMVVALEIQKFQECRL